MLKTEKQASKVDFDNVFYLTQYIPNIIISTRNQYKLLRYFALSFSSYVFVISCAFDTYSTFQVLRSSLCLVAAGLDRTGLENHPAQVFNIYWRTCVVSHLCVTCSRPFVFKSRNFKTRTLEITYPLPHIIDEGTLTPGREMLVSTLSYSCLQEGGRTRSGTYDLLF